MAIKTTDDCCGCAECIHCGRNKSSPGVFCDNCGEEIGEEVYFVDGSEICKDCLPDVIPHQSAEDFLEG